jgi:hypothetical protein
MSSKTLATTTLERVPAGLPGWLAKPRPMLVDGIRQ